MKEILRTRVGSHCHGTHMPESDQDLRTVFIPTKDYFLGLKSIEMREEKEDGKDIEHWNISKLMRLCIKGNPSALNILFARKVDHLFTDEPWGVELMAQRDKFLSKRTITAIVGYCISQIHKLTIGRGAKEGKRATLIAERGYDTKFCYHAVMLTNMGIELVKTGLYSPYRKVEEQAYLRQVRKGEIPLDDVRHIIEENLKTIKMIESVCKLPNHPDEEALNVWLTDFMWRYYSKTENGEVI